MAIVDITIRAAQASDAPELARLYAETWRTSYRGIIPGTALEEMIARRPSLWWGRVVKRGGLLALDFDGTLAGYARFGPSRAARDGRQGEIYEIYLRSEFQGAGLGRQLFQAARSQLAQSGHQGLVVWSLEENDAARRFYTAIGGKLAARSTEVLGGKRLPMIGFVWR